MYTTLYIVSYSFTGCSKLPATCVLMQAKAPGSGRQEVPQGRTSVGESTHPQSLDLTTLQATGRSPVETLSVQA